MDWYLKFFVLLILLKHLKSVCFCVLCALSGALCCLSTAALFHLSYRTCYLCNSSSELCFCLPFQSFLSWKTDVEGRGCREQGGWLVRFHSGVWSFLGGGLGFISAQEICFPGMLNTILLMGETWAVCAAVLSKWCMTDSHDHSPGSGLDCENLLKLLSFEINLQCDPWSVRPQRHPEKMISRAQPLCERVAHSAQHTQRSLKDL